jgi:IS1 family transposase/transposase-like protein
MNTLTCPTCQSKTIKKNGSIHNGKQKYECLFCKRQFIENPQNKLIPEITRERIRRCLLERVSLEGICRIFDVSMTWLLDFIEETYKTLPEDLNADVVCENEEFSIAVLSADELWSFVGNKRNEQWLWLMMHTPSRQIVAFHMGDRSKRSGEALMAKIPEDLKKKPSFIQINSQFTMKLSHGNSTKLLEKNRVRQATLKDLIAH